MRPPTARGMLDAWERGLAESPVRRGLALLSAACPETPLDALARESVGRRDARLLALREWAFGPRLVSVADCPQCGERLETSFDVDEIRVQDPPAAEGPLAVSAAGYELTFRLPDSRDLAALTESSPPADLEGARRRLFERCLLGCRGPDGEEVAAGSLPAEALRAVTERMAGADPQAEVDLSLRCPACGHSWLAPFDIASFLWAEADAWARRLLVEIHALACAYGWREAEILALSPWRRRAYLELIGR